MKTKEENKMYRDRYGRRKFDVGYKLYGGDFELEQYETIFAISEDDAKQYIFDKYDLSEDSRKIDIFEVTDIEREIEFTQSLKNRRLRDATV